jgi:PleD family two-component response regulator
VISQVNEILQATEITKKLRFITFSMGITVIEGNENSSLALTRADEALDSAKKAGRNYSRTNFLKKPKN